MMKALRSNMWRHPKDRDQATAISLGIKEIAAWLRAAPEWLCILGRKYVPRPNEARDKPASSTDRLTFRIEKLEAEIAYRQLLLEEVVHRTKNTLQLAVATLDEHIDA